MMMKRRRLFFKGIRVGGDRNDLYTKLGTAVSDDSDTPVWNMFNELPENLGVDRTLGLIFVPKERLADFGFNPESSMEKIFLQAFDEKPYGLNPCSLEVGFRLLISRRGLKNKDLLIVTKPVNISFFNFKRVFEIDSKGCPATTLEIRIPLDTSFLVFEDTLSLWKIL